MARGQRTLPNLPREQVGGVWPQFIVNDRSFMRAAGASPTDIERMRKRNRRANYRRALRSDLANAVLKGLLLGLMAFGLWYGLLRAIHVWWVGTGIMIPARLDLKAWLNMFAGLTPTTGDWARALPWLLPLCLTVVLTALFGADAGMLLLFVGCVALGVPTIPTHPLSLAGILLTGALARCLYELPESRRPDSA